MRGEIGMIINATLKQALEYMGNGGTVYFDADGYRQNMYIPHNSSIYFSGTNNRVFLDANFLIDNWVLL